MRHRRCLRTNGEDHADDRLEIFFHTWFHVIKACIERVQSIKGTRRMSLCTEGTIVVEVDHNRRDVLWSERVVEHDRDDEVDSGIFIGVYHHGAASEQGAEIFSADHLLVIHFDDVVEPDGRVCECVSQRYVLFARPSAGRQLLQHPTVMSRSYRGGPGETTQRRGRGPLHRSCGIRERQIFPLTWAVGIS